MSEPSQTCLDSASGWEPVPASLTSRSGQGSPSWWDLSPPEGGSTQGQARSSSACPPGRHWDSAATIGREALWARGLGWLRRVDNGSATHPSRIGADVVDPPCAPTPPCACVLCPAAPACTWPAGSNRRPAAARRRCARARAPGGTAHASAPAWQRRYSRWAGGRMRYFSVFGDPQAHRPALQGAHDAPGTLPSELVLSFPSHRGRAPTAPVGLPSNGRVALPALDLRTIPSTCHHPGSRFAVPVTKGQLTETYSAASHSPGRFRETSTALTRHRISRSCPEAPGFLGFKTMEKPNYKQEEAQPFRKTSCQLQEPLQSPGVQDWPAAGRSYRKGVAQWDCDRDCDRDCGASAKGQPMLPLGGRGAQSVLGKRSWPLTPQPVSFHHGLHAQPQSMEVRQFLLQCPWATWPPWCGPGGRCRGRVGHSLIWEELQGPAAC